jgi:hypothetical protein
MLRAATRRTGAAHRQSQHDLQNGANDRAKPAMPPEPWRTATEQTGTRKPAARLPSSPPRTVRRQAWGEPLLTSGAGSSGLCDRTLHRHGSIRRSTRDGSAEGARAATSA